MNVVVNGIKDGLPLGSKLNSQSASYYQNILLCLGYQQDHLPLADLLRHYHQLTGQWLIASPVHWEASHNDAMLIAAGKALQLTEDESSALFTAVAEFLKAEGFSLVYHDEYTWLLKVDDKPPINSQSLPSLLHQSLTPILLSLDNTLFWQRLITELQMYLSTHYLNTKRQGLTINGLWFWGEGQFKLEGSKTIITDDRLLQDLAAATGTSISLLNSTTRFSKDALIIINEPKQLEYYELEKKIKKKTVNWYWNNVSYSTKANYWWSRRK